MCEIITIGIDTHGIYILTHDSIRTGNSERSNQKGLETAHLVTLSKISNRVNFVCDSTSLVITCSLVIYVHHCSSEERGNKEKCGKRTESKSVSINTESVLKEWIGFHLGMIKIALLLSFVVGSQFFSLMLDFGVLISQVLKKRSLQLALLSVPSQSVQVGFDISFVIIMLRLFLSSAFKFL